MLSNVKLPSNYKVKYSLSHQRSSEYIGLYTAGKNAGVGIGI